MTAGRPVRPRDVLSFNRQAFVGGPVLGLAAIVGAAAVPALPRPVRVAMALAGIAGLGLTAAATVATWRVFGPDAEERWQWIRSAAEGDARWLNLTTGFDDSSDRLRAVIDGAGTTIDVFDETGDHAGPLRVARAAFPPANASVALADLDAAVEPGAFLTVFLLMSAHETHGGERLALFAAARRALAPSGRLVLVEHLRDRANMLAFGPGAWHFSGRDSWLRTASDAGFLLTSERRLDPWVCGFVFEPRVG